jgi:hypothetical protein
LEKELDGSDSSDPDGKSPPPNASISAARLDKTETNNSQYRGDIRRIGCVRFVILADTSVGLPHLFPILWRLVASRKNKYSDSRNSSSTFSKPSKKARFPVRSNRTNTTTAKPKPRIAD